MSTFGVIKDRVAGEMKRGELSASATAVQASILSAIAYFERRRFWFNEFVDDTFTASSSATYTSLSAEVLVVDSLKAVIGSRDYPLTRRTWKELDNIDAGQFYGYPDYYALHSKKLRLYPPPNSNYTLKMAGVKRLPDISASATPNATNEWVAECEEMIRCRAKATLFRDELRNIPACDYWKMEAERVYKELNRENTAKVGTGRVRLRQIL